MSKTIENAFNPIPTGFGSAQWLEHASIAILCRALIECITVMLYIGGVDIPEDEWDCRKRLFILHELVNRTSFLSSINYDFDNDLKNTQLEYAKEKLSENPFFKTLPKSDRSSSSAEMTCTWMAVTKRCSRSAGARSSPAACTSIFPTRLTRFPWHSRVPPRTIYTNDSAGAMVTAGFGIEFARMALGRGCVHMLCLFPDTELAIDQIVVTALKSAYAAPS